MNMNDTTDPRERRSTGIRAQLEIKVDLALLGTYQLTRMINISLGGAFICHEDLQPIGTVLKISFKLPSDSQIIETQAKVAWSYKQAGKSKNSSTGMGVEFIEIKQEDQKRIKDFIEKTIATKSAKKNS